MPLLFWQAPWILDDSSKHASHAFLKRIAHRHVVWWDTASSDQQAVPEQAASRASDPNGSGRSEALLGVMINGHLVQVFSVAPWHALVLWWAVQHACLGVAAQPSIQVHSIIVHMAIG